MVTQSSTGRFVAVGRDEIVRMEVLKWAEDVNRRLERMLGFIAPFERRVVHLIISQSQTNGFPEAVCAAQIEHGRLVQRCHLHEYGRLDRETAEESLCRLLLEAYVLEEARKNGGTRQAGWWPCARAPIQVPIWLSEGLAQNLYPHLRARNYETVMLRWQSGRVPTAAEIIRCKPLGPDGAVAPQEERAVRGVFVGWLLALTNSQDCFRAIFQQLAATNAVSPEWLGGIISGDRSAAELDAGWDRWVLRQKRMVRVPGTVPRTLLQQLDAELLLYPGVSGIPEGARIVRPMKLKDLIAERKAPWVRAWALERIGRLRLLAVGRGQRFGSTVEAYCRFLEALSAGARRAKLEKLLVAAEKQRLVLRVEVEEASLFGDRVPDWD